MLEYAEHNLHVPARSTMADISESEALTLLARPLICLDCGRWISPKDQPELLFISAGLTGDDGLPTDLSVELRYRKSAKTNLETFIFTVLMRSPRSNDRVYQVEVKQTGRPIKDAHKRPHEHMGDRRRVGPATWRNWGYDEVLQCFCGPTHISFQPVPPFPGQPQRRKKR